MSDRLWVPGIEVGQKRAGELGSPSPAGEVRALRILIWLWVVWTFSVPGKPNVRRIEAAVAPRVGSRFKPAASRSLRDGSQSLVCLRGEAERVRAANAPLTYSLGSREYT
jgi:hypothetical protein